MLENNKPTIITEIPQGQIQELSNGRGKIPKGKLRGLSHGSIIRSNVGHYVVSDITSAGTAYMDIADADGKLLGRDNHEYRDRAGIIS